MTISYAPPVRKIVEWAELPEIRRALIELQEHTLHREPEQSGDPLDKVITWRDAVANGLAQYSLGVPGQGVPGTFEPPPISIPDYDDLTPPDPLTGLAVTSIPTGFFVEFDAPTYSQGGGNAYSIIYRANYSGAGPLPVFSAAVEVGRCTERSPILVIAAEPGTQSHFWAQPVSHAEDFHQMTPQTPPTGGLNGEYTVAGQLSNDHIANLSADKLTVNSVAVGIGVRSTGFVSGSFGFELQADGDAEFNNAVFRGTIYATAGLIGGITISPLNLRTGQTAPNTGVGFWLGIDSGTPKFSIGDPSTYYMFWNGTDLEINAKFTGIELPPFSADIPEGDFIDDVSNGTVTYNTFTSDLTGGDSPFEYLWALVNLASDNDNDPWNAYIDGSATGSSVVVKGFATDNVVGGTLMLFATDSNGRTAKKAIYVVATHGTPP